MPNASTERATQTGALRLTLIRLTRRVNRHGGAGLTPSQLSLLSTLARHGATSLGRLSELEQVGKSTMTRIAANVEAVGLAVRTQDPHDGRVFALELTSRGHELLDAASQRADDYLDRQIAALTMAERVRLEQCIPVLQRLLQVKA